MAKQMKKYITVTTASFMAMQLAACGKTETQTVKESTATTDNTTEETNPSTAGNGLQSVYDSDMANSCKKWKESDDGSFECLDENSPHYAHHFFNGLMYATAGAMIGSAIYKSHNLRNGTDREDKGGSSAVPRTNYSNTSESKMRILMELRRMALKIRLVQHLVAQITQQQIAQSQIQAVLIPIRVASVHTQIVQVHRRIVLILIQITHHLAQGNQALAQVVPLEVALHLLKRRNQYGQIFSTTPSILFSIS